MLEARQQDVPAMSEAVTSMTHAIQHIRKHYRGSQHIRAHQRRQRFANPLHHIWARPRLLVVTGHPPHEHWIELINDLILVGMLSNLAHLFVHGGLAPVQLFMSLQVFELVLQSLQFVSLVVNIWVVDDLMTLLFFVCVLCSAALMSLGLHCESPHFSCVCRWVSQAENVGLFDAGVLGVSITRILFHLQAGFFERRARKYACVFISADVFILLVLVVDWNITSATHVWYKHIVLNSAGNLAYMVSFFCTDLFEFLDMHHVHSRMDVLVLIVLGEWMMQTVTKGIWSGKFHTGVMRYTAWNSLMIVVIALNYFNTRLEGSHGARKQILFIELVLNHCLLICLFIVAMKPDVDVFLSKLSKLDGAVHVCEDGHVDWSVDKAIWVRSAALGGATLLLLLFRHLRKVQVQPHLLPGKKFWIRVCLSACHSVVPLMSGVLSDGLHIEKDTVSVKLHLLFLLLGLLLEISVHRLDVDLHRCVDIELSSEHQTIH